jgi:hypothetical protein
MDILAEVLSRVLTQFQSPALAFLIGGMLLAAWAPSCRSPARSTSSASSCC